jgi:hypothetical protein
MLKHTPINLSEWILILHNMVKNTIQEQYGGVTSEFAGT